MNVLLSSQEICINSKRLFLVWAVSVDQHIFLTDQQIGLTKMKTDVAGMTYIHRPIEIIKNRLDEHWWKNSDFINSSLSCYSQTCISIKKYRSGRLSLSKTAVFLLFSRMFFESRFLHIERLAVGESHTQQSYVHVL